MRLGGWGHIGWLVRHWSHCELLTCVVDVFVALFMVGHLKFDKIEGKEMELTSSTCMYSVSHLDMEDEGQNVIGRRGNGQ